MTTDLTIVLAHGSWHGPWSWGPVVPLLEQRGFSVLAPQLPSSGPDPNPDADLRGDAEVLRTAVAAAGGPVLLVGHSSGGAAITQASAGMPSVVGLVYLAAFMPDAGESILSLVGPDLPPWIRPLESGMLDVDEAAAPQLYYGCCDADTVAWALPQRTLRSMATDAQPVDAAGWREHPSLYVLCTRDETLPPEMQRQMSAHADRVVELDTDHFPQLSLPERTVDVIVEAAVGVATG